MRHGCPRGACKVRIWDLLRKERNIDEKNLNRTTSELDLCILVTHYWNFSKSKGHNSAENY